MTQVPRLVSLGLLATLIVLLGLTFFHVLAPFLLPLFVAAVLAMLSQPLHQRMLRLVGNRPAIAAGLTTSIVLASVMIPLSLGTFLAARQMYALGNTVLQGTEWNEVYGFASDRLQLHEWHRWIHEVTGDAEVDDEQLKHELQGKLKELSTTLVNRTLAVAGSTPSLLGGVASAMVSMLTFVVAYYYFLADGPEMLLAAERLIPVHRDYKRHLLQQFEQAVRAVVVATFAAAVAQGVATGIGMQICGANNFFIVTMLATLTALVPLLGTWLVWGPFALWLGFHDGDWVRAGMLTAYGMIVVGLLDNVIRAYVLHSNVELHPLLAFVSVMGGIQLMGLWGLFVGPVVASCLHALVKIFNTELFQFSALQRTEHVLDPDLDRMKARPDLAPSATPVASAPRPAPSVGTAAPSDSGEPASVIVSAIAQPADPPPSAAGNSDSAPPA